MLWTVSVVGCSRPIPSRDPNGRFNRTRKYRDDKTTEYPLHGCRGARPGLIGLHQSIRSGPADHRGRSYRRRQRGGDRRCRCWRTRCGSGRRYRRSGGCGGRPYHYATAASIPLLTARSPSLKRAGLKSRPPNGIRCNPAAPRTRRSPEATQRRSFFEHRPPEGPSWGMVGSAEDPRVVRSHLFRRSGGPAQADWQG
jgi:hypothetical protein